MTEAEARQRIAEIFDALKPHSSMRVTGACYCNACNLLINERRDLRAYLDSLKGETA